MVTKEQLEAASARIEANANRPHWTERVPRTTDDVVEAICNLERQMMAGSLVRNYSAHLRMLASVLREIRDEKKVFTETFGQLFAHCDDF